MSSEETTYRRELEYLYHSVCATINKLRTQIDLLPDWAPEKNREALVGCMDAQSDVRDAIVNLLGGATPEAEVPTLKGPSDDFRHKIGDLCAVLREEPGE